jgi:hypothetical protein
MNEEFKDENPSVLPQAEPDVVVLIKKMQQQLIFLEKKIDILINQSQGAPPREKYFSKPYRSFDRSHRYGKGERDSSPGERGPAQGRTFEKRHGEESRGFGPKKKTYNSPQRGFDSKKKPFYYGRKERG